MKDLKEMFLLTGLFALVMVIPVGVWHAFDFVGFRLKAVLWAAYYLGFTAAIAENFLRKRGLGWDYIGVARTADLRRAALIGLGFAAVSVAAGWFGAEVAGLRESGESPLAKFLLEKLSLGLRGQIFLACFMLPIALCEELVFRGIIFNHLEKRRGFVFALLASSLLFALIHGTPARMAMTFVYGLAWGVAFKSGRSLAAPVTAHYLHNVTAFYF